MDTALTPAQPFLGGRLAQLPVKQILALCVGLALLVATIAATFMWTRTSDYKVLFANLGDKDGGAVIAALSQMNIPYQFAEAGGAILVPESRVHDARLRLASQGLPKGGTVGFELMETQKFGVTQFQERLNFQRGLEGELTRSIQSLAVVQGARVHLALPTQTGFLREQQKPSASVLLSLAPGGTLDRSQIAGIVHLVASSVPDMAPSQVSVVDQNGTLLSSSGVQAAGLDAEQLGYMRRLESNYVQRVIDIVEPIVGRGNVKAQVNADVDFTQSESTAEEYKPNQGKDAPAAIRSQQMSENSSKDGGAPAQGVPGALSNQPAPPASAPINGAAQPVQAAAGANASGGGSSKRDSTTNFEVDKTVRVTRNATGAIKRLTAAVVINHKRVVDSKGKVTYTPLSEKEIESINSLVREAIGVNKDRGDVLNIVNAAFSREEVEKPVELPIWKQPDTIALAREIGKNVGLFLIGLLTILMVIRPALKALTPVPGAANRSLNETVQNDVALPPPGSMPELSIPGTNQQLAAQAMKLAKDNPAGVANVVRGWVNNG